MILHSHASLLLQKEYQINNR